MLSVMTSATNSLLTTVAKVKARAQVSGSTDDAFLADCVREASSLIETETGRRFAMEKVRETIAGTGGLELLLERRPVLQVDLVTCDGAEIDTEEILIDDPDAGILWREDGFYSGPILERGLITEMLSAYNSTRPWVIEYWAGYECFPDPDAEDEEEGEGEGEGEGEEEAPTPGPLPPALVGVATEVAIRLFDDRRRNPLRTQESEGDASATYEAFEAWLRRRCAPWRGAI